PYGMLYVATRRVGAFVWVRICDFMAPNVHQFTREIEEAASERIASRPVVIRWAVPVDDTRTLNFELAQVDPAWGLTPEQSARARGEARPDNHDVLSGHRPARPCLGDRRPRAAAPGRPPRRRRRPPAAVAPLSFLQQPASRAWPRDRRISWHARGAARAAKED